MEIYKYSRRVGGLTFYFPLIFFILTLGSFPLFYAFYNVMTPLLPVSAQEWSTFTFIILIFFFSFYLIQVVIMSWFLSFYLSEKFVFFKSDQLTTYRRTWPFRYEKSYELSQIKEVRVKSCFIPGLFKIELKGDVFLVLKYTFSFEKAKKVVNSINLLTGLPIKDEV